MIVFEFCHQSILKKLIVYDIHDKDDKCDCNKEQNEHEFAALGHDVVLAPVGHSLSSLPAQILLL